MVHFAAMGRSRAWDALTPATALSTSLAAARIRSRIAEALNSMDRVFR